MAEDEVKLRLAAETLGYRKAWADVRVQTARDLAAVKTTVATSLNQARQSAAQSLAGIRTTAAEQLGQTRVVVASQLAQIKTQTARDLQQIRNETKRTLSGIGGDISGFGSQMKSAGASLTVGLTAPLAALAAVSVKSARDIDAQVNVLKAFTGSTEAAEKRLAQLVATSQKTPGLTSGLALTLDAQLRPLKVAEQTIDRILPALGRLNAVSPLGDPDKFARNLTQIVTQNFERTDLKELVGQSPIAGQLITEIFKVDSPINSEAIRKSARKMGITTVDAFFVAFAEAAARNEGLANVTESIGTRFDKLVDRILFSLRPLGLAIIDALLPAVEPVAPIIEKLGEAFASLPASARFTLVVLGGIAAAVGPAIVVLGALVGAIGAIVTAVGAVGAPVLAGIAVVVAAVVAGAAALVIAWQTNFGGIQETTERVLAAVASLARDHVDTLVAWWQENLPLIRQTVETVLNAIRAFWDAHGKQITNIVSGVWESVKTYVQTGTRVLLGVIRLALQVINEDWRGAWLTFEKILVAAVSGVLSVTNRLPSMIGDALRIVAGIVITASIEIQARAADAGFQIGRAIVLNILRGISSINPTAAIAGALIIAITGASAQATETASKAGSEAGQAYAASFNQWLAGLGRTDLTGGVGEFIEKPKPAAPSEADSKKAAKALERARAESISAASTAAETAYKEAVNAAEKAYEETGSLVDLTIALKKAELERWEARKAQFDAEREEIRREGQREDQSAELTAARLNTKHVEERAAHSEHRLRMAELDTQFTDKQLAELQRRHARELELFDSRAREYIEKQKALAQAETITYAEAQRRITEEQKRGFDKRREFLEKELEAAKGNAEKVAELTHQLAVLAEEAAAFKREAGGAATSATIDDLDRLQDKINQVNAAIDRMRDASAEAPFATPGFDLNRQTPQGEGPWVDPAATPEPPPAAPWMTFGDVVADVSNRIGQAVGTTGQVVQNVFNGMAQAVTSTVQAFGGLLKAGQNMGAFVKAVVSSIAKTAVVQALYEVAQAAAAFALSFFWPGMMLKAKAHLKAAALYGVVAGVAGAASAAMGSAGSVGSAGAMADYGPSGGSGMAGERESERTKREREQAEKDRNTRREDRREELHVYLHSDEGFVVDSWVRNYDRGGKVRDVVVGNPRG